MSDVQRIRRHGTGDRSYWAFGALALVTGGVLLATGRGEDFERFLGPVPPLAVLTVTALAGAAALRFLEVRGWSPGGAPSHPGRAIGEPALTAIAFAGAALIADVAIGFSEDMNTPWPRSVLFYPAIALVAEVVFHLVPLTLVIAAAGGRWAGAEPGRRVWPVIAVVAASETIFQVLNALGEPEPVIAAFVGPHLFAIGVYELMALRRFGFVAIAVFRLTYYLLWHIAWGALRLEFLY